MKLRCCLTRCLALCLALCLVGLLAGCAGLPSAGDSSIVTDRAQPLGPALERFALSGRLMLQQGKRRDHLNFEWDHSAAADNLLLTTSFGQGVARFARDAAGARLEMADGRRFVAEDWQMLTQNIFGQGLPLDELPHWLRGARPQWRGEIAEWRVAVSEANSVMTPSRQRRLLPRVLSIESADTVLRLTVDAPQDLHE